MTQQIKVAPQVGYRSVLITKKGGSYDGVNSVKGKRVTYVKEASSGEAFARKLFGGKKPSDVAGTKYIPSKSHGIGIKQVQAGRADFAFVKNLVWESVKDRYPNLFGDYEVEMADGLPWVRTSHRKV